MKYSRIIGTGSYLPERVLTNAEIEKMVDTSDAWIIERTGIRKRHIAAVEETTSSMGTMAAQHAIESAGINKDEIELIVVATSTPDRMFPSTACLIQEKLGLDDCAAFDVSAACAGFNYALSVADQYIRAGTVSSALVLGCEIMSRVIDWTDRGTCIIFADGAGAVVLRADTQPGIHSTHISAQGKYKDLLFVPNVVHPGGGDLPYMKMLGSEVFKVAVTKLEKVVLEALAANNLSINDIDWLIPHQANLRIIQAVARKLGLPMERVIVTIDEHGNTSAASIPLALDTAVRSGRIRKGDKLLLESFGGGFAWGAAIVTY